MDKSDVIMTSYAFFHKQYIGILLLRHFDVRMTSNKNFIVDFGLRIQKYSPTPNLSKIKQISWQICKFLHFSILQHIHNKKVVMATPGINENCHYVQNDPHRCKTKLEKIHFDILYCYGVIKESLPGGRNPPSQVRL